MFPDPAGGPSVNAISEPKSTFHVILSNLIPKPRPEKCDPPRRIPLHSIHGKKKEKKREKKTPPLAP